METTVTILNEEGLHARPAAILVNEAKQYSADIAIHAAGKVANAKSIMSVMTLGLKKDAELQFVAKGEDAEVAVSKLVSLVNNKFNLH